MDVHWLFRLATRVSLEETRAETFDLNAGTSLLLNVLYKHSLVIFVSGIDESAKQKKPHLWTNNLGSNIEIAQRFQVDWNLLLEPFALPFNWLAKANVGIRKLHTLSRLKSFLRSSTSGPKSIAMRSLIL